MTQARPRQEEPTGRARVWMLWLLAAVLLLAGVIWVTAVWLPRLEGPAFETLVIKGERRQLSAEELRERVRPALKPGYFGADLGALRDELEAEPWVAAVSVRRQWPSTLELTVHEQQAVAVWNRSGFLNEQAEFFVPTRINRDLGALPELSGPPGSEEDVLAVYREIQATLDGLELEASGLALSERRAWTLELKNGPSLRLGRQDREARFQRFATVALPALERSERVDFDKLAYIDMRYTNGFSVAPSGAGETEDQGNG